MAASTVQRKRVRHVPVKNASHVYKSQRGDGSFVYEVRHPRGSDGKRLYEVVGTRLDQAKARAREVYTEGAPRLAAVGMTLAEVAVDWKQHHTLRPASADTYERIYDAHVAPRLGRVKVRDLDRVKIVAWLNGLQRRDGKGPLADGTRALILSTLNMILAHAVEMGAIGAVPRLHRRHKPKPSPARQRVLSVEEERDLLRFAYPWLRPIIQVALHQALRLGEVAALRWEDVEFVGETLWVRHSLDKSRRLGPPKGGVAKQIPLTPVARQALLQMRAAADGQGFVFTNGSGDVRSLRHIQVGYNTALERAAIKDATFHALRHTGISRLANHPAIPLVHVRDFARHSDISTTQGYVHKIESEKVTAAFGEALAG